MCVCVSKDTSGASPLIGSLPAGWRIEIQSLPSGYTIHKYINKDGSITCMHITIGMIKFIIETKSRWIKRVIFRKGHCGLHVFINLFFFMALFFYFKISSFINCFRCTDKCNIPTKEFSQNTINKKKKKIYTK